MSISDPGLVKDLLTLRRLSADLTAERRRLADNLDTLGREGRRLQRLCQDFRAGLPPLSLLLDNVHNLVLRRALRENPGAPMVVLLYGADAGALIGNHQLPLLAVNAWYDRIHPADRTAYLEAEEGRERCQRGYAIEFRYTHARTGQLHWARETAAAPYWSASGKWLLDSYILDITEQKRAEERLRASEERYRAVVEDQSEYIRRLDPDGRLTFVNGALCRLLQKPRDELLGTELLALLPEQQAKPLGRRLRSLTRARPTVAYELEVTGPDGAQGWQEWTERALFDEAGQIREYQSVGRDITERKLAERQARYLSQHDPLTRLPNRALLEEHLRQALRQAHRDRRRAAVLLLDLDGFKRVNDTHGHQIGDRLLRAVAHRLRASVRASDVVARLGGDEFAVALTAIDDPRSPSVSADKLIQALARPFDLGSEPMLLAASGGIALYPDHADTPAGLIHAADVALYRAKREGRNMARLYVPAMAALVSERRRLEQDLRRALERSELELFYQPRVDLPGKREVAVEALMRWRRPGHGMLMPQSFLDVAAEVGLGLRLDHWAIDRACRQAVRWREAGLASKVAINLAAGQVNEPRLAGELERILDQTGLEPRDLELELSEHTVIDADSEATIACLRRVADLGVSLAVDDFGSGFSSFAYLRRLPVHTIKIDGSFIARIGQSREDEIIIKAIIDLSHALGKRVVAEGVETQTQLAFLQTQGCDEAQGFLFCPPMPVRAVETWRAGTVPAAELQPDDQPFTSTRAETRCAVGT